jgi:hypothetical protein
MKPSGFKFLRPMISLTVLLSALASGCAGEKMPKYSILQGLRVIGLLLDFPEVGFDGISTFSQANVTLTPVISDLYGGTRSLSYNLYHCIDPGVGVGAIPTCSGNPSRVDVDTAEPIAPSAGGFETSVNRTGATASITIPLSSLDPSFYAAKFQSLTAAQKFNGFSILIFFELYPDADESKKIITFKRLIVSGPAKVTKNSNPSALTFLNGSTNLNISQTLPTVKSSVDAFVPAIDFETYLVMDASGNTSSTTESIETAWFLTGPEDVKCSKEKECTTDGLFTLSRTIPGELNAFTPPEVSTPTSRGRILIGVAKDNRGGSTVTRICDSNGNAANCP